MYTQCPECQTLFRIGSEQLKAAGGNVRCCRCDSVFNALNYLHEDSSGESSPSIHDPLAAEAAGETGDQTFAASSNEIITDYLAELQLSETDKSDKGTAQHARLEPRTAQSAPEEPPATETSTSLFSDYLAELNISEELGGNIDSATLPIRDDEAIPEYSLDEPAEPPSDTTQEAEEKETEGTNDLASLFFYTHPKPQNSGGDRPQSDNPNEPEIDPEAALPEPLEITQEPLDLAADRHHDATAPDNAEETPDRERSGIGPEEAAPEFSLEQESFYNSAGMDDDDEPALEWEEPGNESGDDQDDTQLTLDNTLGEAEEDDVIIQQAAQSGEPDEEALQPPPFDLPAKPLPEIEPAESDEPSLEDSLAQPIEKKQGSWLWVSLILLLIIIGLAQLAWFEREHLNRYPGGRELLLKACAFFGCEVQPQSAPDAFKVIERAITSHPSQPNALLLQLTFANSAAFSQAYPRLQLSLFDNNESLVARRVFLPGEYLDKELDATALIGQGEQIRIQMSLQDPGSEVTGFVFDFN